MRYSLVILYFVAVYYILRPAVPVSLPEPATPEPASRPETYRVAVHEAAAAPLSDPQKVVWQPPTRALTSRATPPPSAGEAASTEPPIEKTAATLAAIDKPGEQHTSSRAAPELDVDGADIEKSIKQELTRLACLTGRPEKSWGKKSRAAMRRFAARAKAGNGAPRDKALLQMLKTYPANYCKLCRPGRASCVIEATGTLGEKTHAVAERSEKPPRSLPSYLPPWMVNGVARTEDGVQTDGADIVQPKTKTKTKKAQRKRRSRSTTARGQPRTYGRRAWAPWPYGY